jgi:hypothetical protein
LVFVCLISSPSLQPSVSLKLPNILELTPQKCHTSRTPFPLLPENSYPFLKTSLECRIPWEASQYFSVSVQDDWGRILVFHSAEHIFHPDFQDVKVSTLSVAMTWRIHSLKRPQNAKLRERSLHGLCVD